MKTTATKYGFLAALFLGSALAVPAVQVTFQVNMEVQTATGNFNPAAHTVEVHGSFDGWGAGIMLSVNPTNAGIYQGTANVSGTPGAGLALLVVRRWRGLPWARDRLTAWLPNRRAKRNGSASPPV